MEEGFIDDAQYAFLDQFFFVNIMKKIYKYLHIRLSVQKRYYFLVFQFIEILFRFVLCI